MRVKLLLVCLSFLSLAACQQGQIDSLNAPLPPLVEPIDPAKDPIAAVKAQAHFVDETNDIAARRAEILALVGDAKADHVSQCKVIGIGSKPCGGPASYIAVSSKFGNESTILSLVSVYNAMVQEKNERDGLVSNCAMQEKPQVVLENGVCILKNVDDSAAF